MLAREPEALRAAEAELAARRASSEARETLAEAAAEG